MLSFFRVELEFSGCLYRRVISLDEYASYFSNIDPVAQYKRWTTIQESKCLKNSEKISHGCSEKVKAVFVASDPVDWGRDIQVISAINII